jgi:hypothetical protein
MDPLYELCLPGRVLLAVHSADGEPRLAVEAFSARSWWTELRLRGRLIGLYR